MNRRPELLVLTLENIDYAECWSLQSTLHDYLIRRKRALLSDEEQNWFGPHQHFVIVCDHPPVYTLGKSGSEEHLKISLEGLKEEGFQFFKINRGGDITYHGPGQLVAYPILDLDQFFTDVHKYVRTLEESVIQVLARYGISGQRDAKHTGVWVKLDQKPIWCKICAIGVHLSRWVTMHGLAFNISTKLEHFEHIIPCGIAEPDRGVCSLESLLGKSVPLRDVWQEWKSIFAALLGVEYREIALSDLPAMSKKSNI